MAEPIGNLLDSLGVTHTPEPGELISSAVVILTVVDADGDVSLRTAWSDGLSWVERLGMIHAVELVERPTPDQLRDNRED